MRLTSRMPVGLTFFFSPLAGQYATGLDNSVESFGEWLQNEKARTSRDSNQASITIYGVVLVS